MKRKAIKIKIETYEEDICIRIPQAIAEHYGLKPGDWVLVPYHQFKKIQEKNTDITTTTPKEWNHLGKGKFSNIADSSKIINVNSSAKELEIQLNKFGLKASSGINNLHYKLREKAGLLNKPTK